MPASLYFLSFFFFNDTATTEIYTLSLHDALPIYRRNHGAFGQRPGLRLPLHRRARSEEHTSELQSLRHLVCRLLLEKKKKINITLLKNKKNKMQNYHTDKADIT